MAKTAPSTATSDNAIDVLKADHQAVKMMFDHYETLKKANEGQKKRALAEQICQALTLHAQLEEAVFYPAVKQVIGDNDLMDEALVEHDSAKSLIAQIQSAQGSEPLFDAKVTVLGEYVAHHVKEEEEQMFPKVKKTALDLEALGKKMKSLKPSA